MTVKVLPAWRTRASPWPRSRNPESAARPTRAHLPSPRRNCTWMRMNSSSRRSSVPGIEPRMPMPSGWPTVSHTFTVAHGWASRAASAGSWGGAATLAAGRATRTAALAATASARMPDRMTTPVQHRDRRPGFGPEPPVAAWSRGSSAGGLVGGRLVLGEVVLRQRHEAGADVRLRRLAGKGRVGLLDALRPDVGRLLGDQRLDGSRLQVGDLLRARVEADDLHLVPLARLLDAGGGALGGEQVRGEDALEVRVLGEHGLRDRRRLRGVVVVELLAEVRQPRGLRTLLEALRAGVGRRDARLDVVDEDLPRAADELRERLRGLLAAALVVARDLRHRHLRLVERGVDEHDLRAVVGELLDRREHRLGVGRRDEHRVGLLRGDGVDDRRLLGRVELVRPLEVQVDAELLRLRLGPAVHRDVELVALDARDERHVVRLLAAARAGARAGRRSAAVAPAACGEDERGGQQAGDENARGRTPPA